MIQRIQSIFLLLSSIGFFSLFKLPFAMTNSEATPLFEDQLFNIQDNPILLGLTTIGGIVSLAAIFLFKNRPLQKRIALLGIIAALFVGGFAFFLMMTEGKEMPSNVEVFDQVGLFVPAISLVMLILATVFINKDEKLVRSSDRLR